MGKLLALGVGLKYPITILKFLKVPGDSVDKMEHIIEYEYKTVERMLDKWNEPYEEEQMRIAQWDCPVEGSITKYMIKEGSVVANNTNFVEIEETCPHDVQFAGLCAKCGKDMTKVTWASSTVDAERARINMIHDATNLKVSQDEASKAEGELQKRLLKGRRLTLVVDLDQTIIHACIEPTVGEWQRDESNPNHEAVKDVKSFQLKDEGPRGLASECWYYIKMRPGLKEFLDNIAEMYELHVYTMGTRAYATHIARLVDPEKKLFGDRIISRDENGSMTAKNLARLFPVDTKMVCIIDDRADVWPSNRPNLIKVVPYDFFKGIGDINSSFLPKREEVPKALPMPKTTRKREKEWTTSETPSGREPRHNAEEQRPNPEPGLDSNSKVSALEELVRMGGGDDQALHSEQVAEQAKTLEKQLIERPLLHRQEQLDQEEDGEESSDSTVSQKSRSSQEPPKHSVLQDDDVELQYLEQHLRLLHKSFYDEFDGKASKVQGGRVAQLKSSKRKTLSVDTGESSQGAIPDVGVVMPRLKSKVLQGTHLLLSGMVPMGMDVKRSEIGLQAMSFGATVHASVSKRLTHVIAPTSKSYTTKVRQAAKFPRIKLVNQAWLIDSMSRWKRQNESPYLVSIPENQLPHRRLSATRSRPASDDGFSSSHGTPSNFSVSESDSQETDYEDLIPAFDPSGNSPIDDLKTFDWKGADDEVEAFLNESDDEDDDEGEESGAESDSSTLDSTNSGANWSPTPTSDKGEKKRKNGYESEESEGDGVYAKKQKVVGGMVLGLSKGRLASPGFEGRREENIKVASPPTPGITGVEGEEDGAATEADLEAEMEKELEAEMERQMLTDG